MLRRAIIPRIYITIAIRDNVRLFLRTKGAWNPKVQYDIDKQKKPVLYNDLKLFFEDIHNSLGGVRGK